MRKNRKIVITTLMVIVLVLVTGVLFLSIKNNKKELLYCQEYTNENGKQDEVDVNAFTEKSNKYAIGANSYGKAVFKNPEEALAELEKEYSEGIELIQKEFGLEDLSQKNYKQYGVYGWQVENGTEEEKEQAEFVSTFMDIYENSFEK